MVAMELAWLAWWRVYETLIYIDTVQCKDLIWWLADPELATYMNNDPTMQFLCILNMVAKNQWIDTNIPPVLVVNPGTIVILTINNGDFSWGDSEI